MTMKKNLVLLGMMGVGKTTLGKTVAKELRFNFFDTDRLIEKQNSMLVKEIFAKKGEAFFRKEEQKIALNCLDSEKSIISLGGGAFINKKIRDKVLSNCVSIWLDLSIKNLSLRLNKNTKRPLLNKKDNLKIVQNIYNERKEIYKLANYKIDCNKFNIKQTVKKIINIYANN